MRKSSRFLCLSGAVLLSAVFGCKSSSSCSGGSCGPAQGGSPAVTSGATYPGAGGASAMTSAMGSSSTMSSGMNGGPSTYPIPTTSSGMSSPTTTSTMYPGMSGAH